MLSLLYVTILAVPLTLLAVAFLLTAVRGAGRQVSEHGERRQATPLATPPSTEGLRATGHRLRHSLGRALDPEPSAGARVVASPRALATPLLVDRQRSMTAAWSEPAGRASVGLATKSCPECDETVLQAARICKRCRHRFDGAAPVSVYDWQDSAAAG